MTTPLEEMEKKLAAMTPQELEARRQAIVASAQGDYESLPTDVLREFAFVVSTLRRRNAGPPKIAKAATNGKAKATIDDLL